jgi:hypothetical protein
MLEIFGVERGASGVESGGDYEGVVDVVAVLLGNF